MTIGHDHPTPNTHSPAARCGEASTGRRWAIDLLLILLLAASMRFIGLGTLDPWEDEVYSFIGSGELLPNQLMWTGQRMGLHSPLPYIEIKFARALLGPGAFSLRFPAACYGTLAALVAYLLFRRLFTRPVALAGAIILAIHPFAIEWARDARMYSHWIATAGVMMLLAHEAARYAREDDNPTILNWRWFTLGLVFNWAHCAVLFSVTTIAAVGLWLGLMALSMVRVHPKRALVILAGSALACGVYLTGWALTGIGRLMHKSAGGGPPPEGAHHSGAELPDALAKVVQALAGEVPLVLAIALIALAVAGLAIILVRGERPARQRIEGVALLVLVALTPWLMYRGIAKQHFFEPRYVIVELLTVCAGWGALLAFGLTAARGKGRSPVALATALAVALACALWWPAWRSLHTQPKIQYSVAFAPIHQHAADGEALIPIPEWYAQLGQYYTFPDRVTLVTPPVGARIFSGVDGRFESIQQLGYQADFDALFAASAVRPPAAWVFIVEPDPQRLATATPILEAYGLTPHAQLAILEHASQGRSTLTFRVSPAGIDHLTTTTGRPKRAWW